VGLVVPNRLVLSLGTSNALAVLHRYTAGFLGADLEAGYTAEGRESFLGVLGYIPAIEGIGLSLTKSLIVAASSITPSGEGSITGAFRSHFVCRLVRF